MTKQLSVTFLIVALLLMQTIAGLHRGSSPVLDAQKSASIQIGADNHEGHSLHHDLFGALEGSSGCHLLDHLLEPPSATGNTLCVSPITFIPERLAAAAPARISRFQLFGPPARGPPVTLS